MPAHFINRVMSPGALVLCGVLATSCSILRDVDETAPPSVDSGSDFGADSGRTDSDGGLPDGGRDAMSSDMSGDAGECPGDHGCHPDARCTLVAGEPECSCPPGFEGDGTTCEAVPGLVDDVVPVSFVLEEDAYEKVVELPRVFDQARTVPFVTVRAESVSDTDPSDVLGHVSLASPTTLGVTRDEPDGRLHFRVNLVEFGPGAEVQKFDYQMSDQMELEIPISTVQPARTFAVFTHELKVMSTEDSDIRAAHERVEFGSSAVRLHRSFRGGISTGTLYLVEAVEDHFSVQQVEIPIAAEATCERESIDPVDPKRAFVLHSNSFAEQEWTKQPEEAHLACYLVDDEVECCRGSAGATSSVVANVQIVEFAPWVEGGVQSGLFTVLSGSMESNAVLSTTTPFTMPWGGITGFPGAVPGGPLSRDEYASVFFTFELDESRENLVATRLVANDEPTTFPWYAITWPMN